ncbi:MAG: hypothetical protein Q9200_001268 [Gallowayella weberi]
MPKSLSILCRGVEIDENDLFDYTNGRFLNDEKAQFLKRRVVFDVSKLCDVASSVSNGSPVCTIEKMEGGFSKALLITMENKQSVIAKIPCHNAGRRMYSTASEAAVLQYVNLYTTVPVPALLAWSADATNPVGAEYIIMEKAPSIQLFKVWDDLAPASRLQLIKSLTQLEQKLANVRFPAYGSLYCRNSISKASERVPLNQSLDPTGSFCIVSLIDWQSKSISPLFLQARWPEFLAPPDDYHEGPAQPTLPPDFEKLDTEERNIALHEKQRADASKAYEVATYLHDRDAYSAHWKLDQSLRELFKRVGDTWDDGIMPLQTCLVRIREAWGKLGFSEPYPLKCSLPNMAASFEQQASDYEKWYEIQDFAQRYLSTDAEGWVAPQVDFEEKREQNKALLELLIQRAETPEQADELKRVWPFPMQEPLNSCSIGDRTRATNKPVYKPAVLKTRFCSVPGTTTSLAINYEVTKTFPFAMREVITAAQKQIRKRIDGGDPNRRLLPSEEPFRVQEWGLVIEAESLEGEHLTWKLLLDAMDGLFLCGLDRDHRNLLKAQIRVANRGRAVTKGWLYLKMAYSKDVARKN